MFSSVHVLHYVTDINIIRPIPSIIHYSVYLLKNLFIQFNSIKFIIQFIY